MKKSKFTLKRIVDGYELRHQQRGGYKITEYSHLENNTGSKKRTIEKDLDLSTAEARMYVLETKLDNNKNPQKNG